MKKRSLIFMFAAIALIATAACPMAPDVPAPTPVHPPLPADVEIPTREARFWQQLDGERVRCLLCVHQCIIAAGERGICRVRENREGRLYTLVYGLLAATPVAPIEKDGMKHALPGTDVLAIATAGCNFRCQQCHNWHITQRGPEAVRARQFTPQEVVDLALRGGARTITGTINEPTVFFEFLYDVAVLAREQGLRMQFHTNGAIAEEPLRALLKRVDQAVVDLKGFCPDIYREYFGGCLEGVLRTLKIIKEEGAWLEIVNLVIPGVNDCMTEIRAMSEWILGNLGPDVPLHFTRFHPAYRLTHLPATPIETLEQAYRVAREAGINFVTIGNVPGHRYNSTFCPDTGERLIHRVHFEVVYNKVVNGMSPFSGRPVPGIWE
jgi:pyruvate formate lyase activating enzyme